MQFFSKQVGCSVCCRNGTGEYLMVSASYLFQLKEHDGRKGRMSRWTQVDFSTLSPDTHRAETFQISIHFAHMWDNCLEHLISASLTPWRLDHSLQFRNIPPWSTTLILCPVFHPVIVWIVSPEFTCWSPNPSTLGCELHLETGSLQM